MAYYSETTSYSFSERLLVGGARLLERAAARHALSPPDGSCSREHNRIYRETLRELASLNDRDLADLGFHRGMLKRIAKDAANKKVAL